MAEQLLREHGDIVDSSTSNAIVRLRHQGVGILRNKGLQNCLYRMECFFSERYRN